jgi:hypothetical protein
VKANFKGRADML